MKSIYVFCLHLVQPPKQPPPHSDSHRSCIAPIAVRVLPFCINDAVLHVREGGMSQMLSAIEAAKMLGVSPWTIRQWSSMRKLPHYKVGRLTKYKMSDLLAFM